MRVINGIPLGCSLLLPVDTVNCVQKLKANALAAVLEESDATSANALRQIPMQSIVVANFVFRGNLAPVDGFG
jgi:hypothetical protein